MDDLTSVKYPSNISEGKLVSYANLSRIFLPEDKIVQKKMNFNITTYSEKDLSKKKFTVSFHRPLQTYFKLFAKARYIKFLFN
jgi:hypothetical protein